VTVDDCRRDIDQLAVGVPCMFAQQREGAPLIDRVALHENPFRTFESARRPNAPSRSWYSAKRRSTMSIELCQSFASASVM
jgi:hypothetical protein